MMLAYSRDLSTNLITVVTRLKILDNSDTEKDYLASLVKKRWLA